MLRRRLASDSSAALASSRPAIPRILSMMNERWNVAGSLSAACAASLCCTLPLAAAGLGLGAASLASAFAPWRPLLIVVVAAFLGKGFYDAYKPLPACGEACGESDPPKSRQGARIGIWLSAAVALSLLGVPYVTGSAAPSAPSDEALVYHVEGMTCAGCEASVEQAIRSVKGVKSVEASFKDSRAVVELDPKAGKPEDVLAAIEKSGYRAQRE
jgi:mercuric ion transport protein